MHVRQSLSAVVLVLGIVGGLLAASHPAAAQPAVPVLNCPPGQHQDGAGCVFNGVRIMPLRNPFQQHVTVGIRRCQVTNAGVGGQTTGAIVPRSCPVSPSTPIGSACTCTSGRLSFNGVVQ